MKKWLVICLIFCLFSLNLSAKLFTDLGFTLQGGIREDGCPDIRQTDRLHTPYRGEMGISFDIFDNETSSLSFLMAEKTFSRKTSDLFNPIFQDYYTSLRGNYRLIGGLSAFIDGEHVCAHAVDRNSQLTGGWEKFAAGLNFKKEGYKTAGAKVNLNSEIALSIYSAEPAGTGSRDQYISIIDAIDSPANPVWIRTVEAKLELEMNFGHLKFVHSAGYAVEGGATGNPERRFKVKEIIAFSGEQFSAGFYITEYMSLEQTEIGIIFWK